MTPLTALVIVGFVVMIVANTTMIYRRFRGSRPTPEQVNEATGRFLSSSDSNDPQCPRCHGQGRLVGSMFGFKARADNHSCPICHGAGHVKYG